MAPLGWSWRQDGFRVSVCDSRPASFLLAKIMLETGSFLQNEMRCLDLAYRAVNEADRDFWLQLAHRWEEVLRVKKSAGPNFEAIHKLRFERPLFQKRREWQPKAAGGH